MAGKRWTRSEIRKLYQYAEQTTQLDAAKRLNKSPRAVRDKAMRLGIVWRQGCLSTQDLAAAAGCNQHQARRVVEDIYADQCPFTGTASGRRYRIPVEDADRIIREIRRRFGSRSSEILFSG